MSKSTEAFKVRDRRGGEWFYVHNAVIRDFGPDIGPYGIAVYSALCLHAGQYSEQAWPSIATIARMVGASPSRVRRSLKDLEAARLIHIEHKRDDDTGLNFTSVYTLLDVKGALSARGTPPQTVPPHEEYPTISETVPVLSQKQEGTIPQTPKQDLVNKTHLNKSPRASDDARPSPAVPSSEEPPASTKDTPTEQNRRSAPPTTWDDVEAAPAEARRAGRKWTDEHLDWYEALVRVTTGWTRVEFEGRKSERIQKRYHAAAKRLREAGYHTTDLLAHYERGGWWWSDYWLGKERGEWPTVEAIEETWGDWLKSPVVVEAQAPKYPAYNPMPEDQRIPIPQTAPFWFLPGEIRAS